MAGTADSAAPRRSAVIAVGVVAGLVAVAITLSFATLIFSQELASDLPAGAMLFLFGAAVMNFVAFRRTSLEGSIFLPQDTTTAILVVSLAAVIPGVSEGDQFGTALALIVLATAATGVTMYALGRLRLGNLIRFIPYPVVGGFLGGTGLLLVVAATDLVTSGFNWSEATIVALAGAALLAAALLLMADRRPSIVSFLALVIGGVVVFYLLLLATGTTIDEARSLGLLPDPATTAFQLPRPGPVDWSAITSGLGGLLTVPVIGTLALLLNVTGLEQVRDSDADLNRELKTVGEANLVASLTASPAGYQTLGLTALTYRIGVKSRLVTLTCGLVYLAAAVGGATLIGYLPTPVVGGMLLMIGIGFLDDWLVVARKQITGPEYLLMLALVAAVAVFGFLPAVLAGLAAAVVLFAAAYSRIDPVRHISTGSERRSSHNRSKSERAILQERGSSLLVIELQGYLFFGTVRGLVDRIKDLVAETPHLAILVVDLRLVEGVDSTGLASFARLTRLAVANEFQMIFSDLRPDLAPRLIRAAGSGVELTIVANLDSAIEMAETHLLEGREIVDDLSSLADVFGAELWERIEPHLTRVELETDASLAEMGEHSVGLFLVDRGRVAAEIPIGEDRWQRMLSSGPGTILGEMSLYVTGGRTARLRAEMPSCVYILDGDTIAMLERSDQSAAAEFHRRMAVLLAERLSTSNEVVHFLLG